MFYYCCQSYSVVMLEQGLTQLFFHIRHDCFYFILILLFPSLAIKWNIMFSGWFSTCTVCICPLRQWLAALKYHPGTDHSCQGTQVVWESRPAAKAYSSMGSTARGVTCSFDQGHGSFCCVLVNTTPPLLCFISGIWQLALCLRLCGVPCNGTDCQSEPRAW